MTTINAINAGTSNVQSPADSVSQPRRPRYMPKLSTTINQTSWPPLCKYLFLKK